MAFGALAAQSLPQARKRAWFMPKSDDSGVTAISFDTIIRESHSLRLAVTDNPVETGVVVSDHAYMEPARLQIEAAVGDFWLRAKDASGNAVSDVFASPVSRSQAAWKILREWMATAEPFDIQTGLDLYQNFVFEELSAEQDKDTGTFLAFRASLREVIRVSTQTVTFPPRAAGKAKRQADKTKSSGEKQAPPPATPDDAKSMIVKALKGAPQSVQDAVGGLLDVNVGNL